MSKDEEKINVQIPESTLRAMREAQESYRKIAEMIEGIIPKLPKIDIPKFQLPEITKFSEEQQELTLPPNPDVVREENTWERHKETLDVQHSLLGIQSEVLEEQKSNTKLTKWVLGISVAGTLTAAVSLVVSILK
jgi:hypothetical protein